MLFMSERSEEIMQRKLRGIMAERQVTLTDLHERTGIAVSTLSDIRRGKQSPTVKTLEKIAEGLGVSVKDFFVE